MQGFASNFACCFPWAIRSSVAFGVFDLFCDFLRLFFVFINMGPYESENFKTLLLLQVVAESFQTFPEFSPDPTFSVSEPSAERYPERQRSTGL